MKCFIIEVFNNCLFDTVLSKAKWIHFSCGSADFFRWKRVFSIWLVENNNVTSPVYCHTGDTKTIYSTINQLTVWHHVYTIILYNVESIYEKQIFLSSQNCSGLQFLINHAMPQLKPRGLVLLLVNLVLVRLLKNIIYWTYII